MRSRVLFLNQRDSQEKELLNNLLFSFLLKVFMKNRNMQVEIVAKHLRIVFKMIQTHSKMIERSCGLSTAQLWMLHAIVASPGVKVSELALILSIHRSTCSNMLDKLEAKTLIYRERSGTDQRAVHLFATKAGENLLLQTPSLPQEKLNTTLQRLSGEQLSNLEESLENLINCLQEDEAKLPV